VQYNGGGNLALIDGIQGTNNWTGGGWQGYQGQDLVATVDLGKVQNVSQVSASFLQDVGAWIMMPPKVDFEFSTDGRTFVLAASIPNAIPERQEGVVTSAFGSRFKSTPVRYVRMRAYNYGKLPAWHPGHGGDAWIFADEITLK
jgi:hypothetical protein